MGWEDENRDGSVADAMSVKEGSWQWKKSLVAGALVLRMLEGQPEIVQTI